VESTSQQEINWHLTGLRKSHVTLFSNLGPRAMSGMDEAKSSNLICWLLVASICQSNFAESRLSDRRLLMKFCRWTSSWNIFLLL